MARAPVAAAETELPEDETMPADAGAEPMPEEGAEPTSTVLVTICKSRDGGYVVYAGDEQEADEAQPEPGMEQGEANAGETFDGIGAALHRVMEILQDDAEGADGQGGAEAQFNAGFSGGAPQG